MAGLLRGKVAIVTGSSRGIGRAAALAFAREEAKVVITARSANPGKYPGTIHSVAEEVRALGGKALAVQSDLTQETDVKALVAATVGEFGQVDILMNNAAVFYPGYRVAALPADLWDSVIETNLRGAFLCCREALRHMIPRRSGSIVNFTAMGARWKEPGSGNLPYKVTKVALESFTELLAEEVREHDIAVNIMDPGMLRTETAIEHLPPSRDLSAFAPPESIGPAMVWLARQSASSMTGQVVRLREFGTKWGG